MEYAHDSGAAIDAAEAFGRWALGSAPRMRFGSPTWRGFTFLSEREAKHVDRAFLLHNLSIADQQSNWLAHFARVCRTGDRVSFFNEGTEWTRRHRRQWAPWLWTDAGELLRLHDVDIAIDDASNEREVA